MLDLLITNATLPDGRTGVSVAVQDGTIVEVTPGLQAPAHETVNANGKFGTGNELNLDKHRIYSLQPSFLPTNVVRLSTEIRVFSL